MSRTPGGGPPLTIGASRKAMEEIQERIDAQLAYYENMENEEKYLGAVAARTQHCPRKSTLVTLRLEPSTAWLKVPW